MHPVWPVCLACMSDYSSKLRSPSSRDVTKPKITQARTMLDSGQAAEAMHAIKPGS